MMRDGEPVTLLSSSCSCILFENNDGFLVLYQKLFWFPSLENGRKVQLVEKGEELVDVLGLGVGFIPWLGHSFIIVFSTWVKRTFSRPRLLFFVAIFP